MNIKKADNINFKQIYFVRPLEGFVERQPNVGIAQLKRTKTTPSIALKNIVKNSEFFQKLGNMTDVFISENSKNGKRFFNAYFNNPYEENYEMVDEIEIISETNTMSCWHNRLEFFTQKLPIWYPDLQMAIAKNKGTFAFMNLGTISLKQFSDFEEKLCKLM